MKDNSAATSVLLTRLSFRDGHGLHGCVMVNNVTAMQKWLVGARPEGREQQACGSSRQPGTTDLLPVWVLKPLSWGSAASLWHYWGLAVTLNSVWGDKAGHWRCALKAYTGTSPVLPLSFPAAVRLALFCLLLLTTVCCLDTSPK